MTIFLSLSYKEDHNKQMHRCKTKFYNAGRLELECASKAKPNTLASRSWTSQQGFAPSDFDSDEPLETNGSSLVSCNLSYTFLPQDLYHLLFNPLNKVTVVLHK